jgi:phospholipid/cholesterol/gamma-HCH transport system permease protein
VFIVGVNVGAFFQTFFAQGTLVDLFGGEIKCMIFGLIVAAICIYKGVTARGGAEGVAKAVHEAIVRCFVVILAFGYLYTPTVLALFHDQLVIK